MGASLLHRLSRRKVLAGLPPQKTPLALLLAQYRQRGDSSCPQRFAKPDADTPFHPSFNLLHPTAGSRTGGGSRAGASSHQPERLRFFSTTALCLRSMKAMIHLRQGYGARRLRRAGQFVEGIILAGPEPPLSVDSKRPNGRLMVPRTRRKGSLEEATAEDGLTKAGGIRPPPLLPTPQPTSP